MKPLSERIKTFSTSQFVDWLCLACVDVREVRTPVDAQEEINKIREALTERLSTLQEQLTATTNSLTNAQEALKSAGIKADTVQAGVMELVPDEWLWDDARRFCRDREISFPVEAAHEAVKSFRAAMLRNIGAADAYLNAVRAEVLENVPTVCDGKEQLAFEAYASSKGLDLSKHPLHYLFLDGKTNQARSAWRECLVYVAAQLRAGNAGKDGE